jgi:hypothetical protein
MRSARAGTWGENGASFEMCSCVVPVLEIVVASVSALPVKAVGLVRFKDDAGGEAAAISQCGTEVLRSSSRAQLTRR